LKNITWRELNHILATKTEAEVLEMLNQERIGRRRVVVLERLHQRYNTLRVARERLDLLSEAAK
jgi:precorrin-6B methylase 1